jgi:transcriptional regulator with XRE-family HTH domain
MVSNNDQDLAVANRIGSNLFRARRREGFSQEELGQRASLHRTEIGKLEKGGRIPGSHTLIRLAGAMAIEPGVLLDGIVWVPVATRSGAFSFNSSPGAADRAEESGAYSVLDAGGLDDGSVSRRKRSFPVKLGRRFRQVRRSKGMTQLDLATRTGLHPATISAVERGTTRAEVLTVFLMQRGLGLSEGELFKWVQEGTE